MTTIPTSVEVQPGEASQATTMSKVSRRTSRVVINCFATLSSGMVDFWESASEESKLPFEVFELKTHSVWHSKDEDLSEDLVGSEGASWNSPRPYRRIRAFQRDNERDVHNLEIVLRDLLSLRSLEEEDEYGPLRPSDHAFTVATKIITDLLVAVRTDGYGYMPRPQVVPDGEGGIRFLWHQEQRQIRVGIPAGSDGRFYLYHEVKNEHGVVNEPTVNALLHWLRWLAIK